MAAPLIRMGTADTLMSMTACSPSYPTLAGWCEGTVLASTWLDAGGPLDAPDYIAIGAVRAVDGMLGFAFASHCEPRGLN